MEFFAQVSTSLTPSIINIGQSSNCAINGVPQIGQYIYSVSAGASVASCCSTSSPPVLTGTPTQLAFTITTINDVPPFTGTVTATYQCTSPVQQTINPVIFSVFGCPVTRTWTATDACFKSTSVQQVFTYPEVFTDPIEITVPGPYTTQGDCSNPVAPDPSVSGTATSNRGNQATITFQDSAWTQEPGVGCTLTRFWQAEDICNSFDRNTQTITYTLAPPPPLTTQSLTTQELTTQELTTQPLTTQPLTTQPLTTSFATVAARCATLSFPETQGYFCAADGSGYYQCLKGPYAVMSAVRPCPAGTSCKCPYGVECAPYGICTYGVFQGPYTWTTGQ